jgi:glyoxylase-like metal-dependent hydrolase (beta-lactamase superfamily II)
LKGGHFMLTVDNETLKGVVPMASLPQEIAPGVFCMEVGKGIMRSNVYFVRSGSSWVLIDTGTAKCDREIQQAAEFLFGVNTRPSAILLTHNHPDHAGSAPTLARRWNCLVYMHPEELPLITMDASNYLATVKKYANPLDTWILLPLLRIMPKRARESMLPEPSFKQAVRTFDPGTAVPGLPDWELIRTSGHTAGHVSFFRPDDRVLITGDAVVNVHLNSLWSFLLWGFGRNDQRLSGPPWYTTWSWRAAKASVASLAQLEPHVLACGHGLPISGTSPAPILRAFAERFNYVQPSGKRPDAKIRSTSSPS